MGSCGYLGTVAGILGGVSVGLGSYAHFESFYIWKVKEEVFIATTALCFAISLFYFLAYLGSKSVQESHLNQTLNFIFHTLAATALAVIAGFVIESTIEIDRKICRHVAIWPYSVPCQLYEEKLIAAIISAVNSLLYGITAFVVIAAA